MRIEIISGHNIYINPSKNEYEVCQCIVEISLQGTSIDEEHNHSYISNKSKQDSFNPVFEDFVAEFHIFCPE